MFRLLAIFACMFITPTILAQRLSWKPADFAPLTGFAWQEDEGLPMVDVLKSIFQEPELEVRYTALASYLETVPVKRLEAAFKACLLFDGTQCPNDTIDVVLSVWGRRDPKAAMAMARKCFAVVITEGTPLTFNRWDRPPTRVMNIEAFRASSFYLTRAPYGLGRAIEAAEISREERIPLLQEFATLTVQATGKLPTSDGRYRTRFAFEDVVPGLKTAMERGIFGLQGLVEAGPELSFSALAFDAACVRLVALDAARLPLVIESIARVHPKSINGEGEWVHDVEIPGDRFLKMWEQLDYPSLLRWTEAQPMHDVTTGVRARGMLMSRVDEQTKRRWLREASELTGVNEPKISMFTAWALWNPEAALKAAVDSKNPVNILRACEGVVGVPANRGHHAFAVIRDFDLGAAAAALPEDRREALFKEWDVRIMERWIEVDVGEAARYGYDFLSRQSDGSIVSRSEFLRLLSGEDNLGGDPPMVDRSLDALCFWAFWQPEGMRRWIETVKDDDMRKALTCLLEHAGERHGPKSATAANRNP